MAQRPLPGSLRAPLSPAPADAFGFRCIDCRSELDPRSAELQACPVGCSEYPCVDGVWRFLPSGRAEFYRRFTQDYEAVRRAEGRGSADPAYYLALPDLDTTGRFSGDWRIRATSFRSLLRGVVRPLHERLGRPLTVLDAGAGNGWLSHRLARQGHRVVALDLVVNAFDGLGAYPRYADLEAYPPPGRVVPVQAEFGRLPFGADAFDLVVFNGSLHYATDYRATLEEAFRIVDEDRGMVVIMDSPVYSDGRSGEAMVREREDYFERTYGFRSDALPSENYLTHQRLAELVDTLGLRWRIVEPFYGIRWMLRPWKARLLRRREPARFLLLVAEREGKS